MWLRVCGDGDSVCMFSLRVEVQAAGGQTQTTTSHISVTVSGDGSRSHSLLFFSPELVPSLFVPDKFQVVFSWNVVVSACSHL